MGSTQQFCLKWNNHQSNMLSIFDQLLSSEHFVDVTLACDGLSVRAHKMVLSACSPFFQSLFIQNPCKHPIVILKDIRFVDLKALVQFMYRGEVNVSQDQLPTLLKAAEALKIKGLAEVTNESGQKPSGALSHNGHHSGLVPKGEQPSVQAAPSPLATPIPTSTPMSSAAQNALVAAMQQNALKAQLAVHAAQAAQNAHDRHTSAASHESNSNASTPLRSTDSPMSQQNRKRRRKSAGSEKGSGDENSGAESGAEDNLEESRAAASDEESAGEENEFEPSKLLEQTMTEVVKQGNQDNNSSSSDNHTKDSSQADMKPVINFDSNAAGALATLNTQDPTAVLAFAAAAQAAGASANSGDSGVAGPSQPTHGVYMVCNDTPKSALTAYIARLSVGSEFQYQCTLCGISFKRRKQAQEHMYKHMDKYPFECKMCSYGTVRSYNLKRHSERIHSGSSSATRIDKRSPEAASKSPIPAPTPPRTQVLTLQDSNSLQWSVAGSRSKTDVTCSIGGTCSSSGRPEGAVSSLAAKNKFNYSGATIAKIQKTSYQQHKPINKASGLTNELSDASEDDVAAAGAEKSGLASLNISSPSRLVFPRTSSSERADEYANNTSDDDSDCLMIEDGLDP